MTQTSTYENRHYTSLFPLVFGTLTVFIAFVVKKTNCELLMRATKPMPLKILNKHSGVFFSNFTQCFLRKIATIVEIWILYLTTFVLI